MVPPVFKTGERCAAALAGSIPVRLRHLRERHPWRPVQTGLAEMIALAGAEFSFARAFAATTSGSRTDFLSTP